MKLDVEHLVDVLVAQRSVQLATLFGSSQGGTVREGGDVDVAVLLSPVPTPVEFYRFYQQVCSELDTIEELDLVDLSSASSILAFEALCGRRLVVRDPEVVAAYSSLIARQYEDDMAHALRYA